jgi:hypothetical protein
MPRRSTVRAVTTIGIDMGKNTLHMVGPARAGLARAHYIEAREPPTLPTNTTSLLSRASRA